ncbi:MAG: hypothetical protein KDK39_11280, partial [Leptospiraceae bacterium]|nr:hypothetical protein [Leptospiraceae bacterium]
MSEKIAIVVQRCHPDVVGGSESLAWQYACLLRDHYQVEVLTTTAIRAPGWQPDLPAGAMEREGVVVRHFANLPGHTDWWQDLHQQMLFAWRCMYDEPDLRIPNPQLHHWPLFDLPMQLQWLIQQGPYSADLQAFIKSHYQEYKKIIFVTYLYAPTWFGLMQLPPRTALLVPTLHDEPPAWMPIFRLAAQRAQTLLWNTQAEQSFGRLLWGAHPGQLVSMGIDLPVSPPVDHQRQRF